MAMGKVIAGIIKAAKKQGKQPNFGAVKTKLEKKIREGTATKEDRSLLKEIRNKDTAATKSQKIKQSQSSRKTPISLAGSSKVGGTQSNVVNKKKYGSKVTKKAAGAIVAYKEAQRKRRVQAAKDLGAKVLKKGGTPKGVGCATRGYGKAMK